MQPTDDSEFLRQYAENNSDEAFAALVTRHINLVYSVAFRQVGNPHHAEEITQAVFIILARKAGQLRHAKALTSWLFQTTRLTANNFVRSEMRRQFREQEAHMQSTLNESNKEIWPQIAPLLDDAVAGLRDKDRQVVLLRFYEGENLREIGSILGASEDAAEKRVSRALEKLRKFFTKRGASSTTAIIAGTISANSVQAAPVALAKSVTAVAIAKGATASISTLTLIKGAMKIMAWTKAKSTIAASAIVLIAAGTTTLTVKTVSYYREESLWNKVLHSNLHDFHDVPSGISIRPSGFTREKAGIHESYEKILGMYQPFETLIARAYGVSPWYVTALSPLPTGEFDYMATTARQPRESLQEMIKSKFGLVGRQEMRETDVLLLTVRRPNASGLKPNFMGGIETSTAKTGSLNRVNGPIRSLAFDLENCLQIPVIDQTGLTGRFNYDLEWDDQLEWDNAGRNHISNPEGLKQVLLDQLGLELVPANMPIEMLVVERAK